MYIGVCMEHLIVPNRMGRTESQTVFILYGMHTEHEKINQARINKPVKIWV